MKEYESAKALELQSMELMVKPCFFFKILELCHMYFNGSLIFVSSTDLETFLRYSKSIINKYNVKIFNFKKIKALSI